MPQILRPVRRAAQSVLVALVVAAASLVVAQPAAAHSSLVSSAPSDGQTVSTPIDRVDLTFSEAPLTGLDAGLRIEVRDATGTDVSTGTVTVAGTTMSKTVDPEDGAYTVLWRYVSPDGHPITGEFGFTVALPAPTASATGAPTVSPSPEPTEIDVTVRATAPPTAAEDTPTTLPVLLAGGIGVLLVAGVLVLAARRRRGPADDAPDAD